MKVRTQKVIRRRCRPRFGVPAARDEARAEGQVVRLERGQQVGDVFRLVGEVAVHLDHEVGAQGQGGLEAVDAARAAAAPLRPDQGVDAGIGPRPFLDDAARAVGRIVVGHEDVDVVVGQRQVPDGPDQVGDVLRPRCRSGS